MAARTTNIHAMIRVQYFEIEDYLRMGYIVYEPPGFFYQNIYGVDMLWLCACSPPTRKREER